ncbi:MAG: hypothetical protein H0V25_10090 [Solirubrobacterales bacterium]|nr:hypothetical protein [Solirubrobacterales bacterium]
MSVLGGAARTAGRLSPWARALAVGEIALTAKRHLDRLEQGEAPELGRLIAKSKGRPGNLTKTERSRVLELVRKLEPAAFARNAAKSALPLRKR